MEIVVANLAAAKARRVTWNGKSYLVAPISLLVSGILPGSQGPLYYPPEEVRKSPGDWNGMPIVVNHPLGPDGNPVSARNPQVLEKSGIGTLYNVRVEGCLAANGTTPTANAFCPTGLGGGVDPHCSSKRGGVNPRNPERDEGRFTDTRPDHPSFHEPRRLAVEDEVKRVLKATDENIFFEPKYRITLIEGPRPLQLLTVSMRKGVVIVGSGDLGNPREFRLKADDPPGKVTYAVLRAARVKVSEELKVKYGKRGDTQNANGTPVAFRNVQLLTNASPTTKTTSTCRLTAEGWFDVQRTKEVDKRVLEALEKGKVMEVSTGLTLQQFPVPKGTVHNGPGRTGPYVAIARNYRPDHLAVLPDTVGACSVADGCGLHVNADSPLYRLSPHFRGLTLLTNRGLLSPSAFRGLRLLANAFCPTGQGGGIDPHCSPGGKGEKPLAVAGSGGARVLAEKEIDGWTEKNGLGGWRDKLSKEEANEVGRYQGSSFGLNEWNRKNELTPDHSEVERTRTLDSAVSKGGTTKEPVTVFRGIEDEGFAAGLKAGAEFTDHAHVSTSLSSEYMGGFFGEKSKVGEARLEIRLPTGTNGAYVGGVGTNESFAHERELLLPRGARFRVAEVLDLPGGGKHAVLDYLGSSPRPLPHVEDPRAAAMRRIAERARKAQASNSEQTDNASKPQSRRRRFFYAQPAEVVWSKGE